MTSFPARVASLQEPLMPHTRVIPHPLTHTANAGIAHIIVCGPEHAGNPFFKVPPIKVTSKGKAAVGASVSHAGPASPTGRRGWRSHSARQNLSQKKKIIEVFEKHTFQVDNGRLIILL